MKRISLAMITAMAGAIMPQNLINSLRINTNSQTTHWSHNPVRSSRNGNGRRGKYKGIQTHKAGGKRRV